MQSCFGVLRFFCSKHTKRQPDAKYAPTDNTLNSPWPPQILLLLLKLPSPNIENLGGRGDKIMVGEVVKSMIGELEEEVRAGCPRIIGKELIGVVQRVLRNKSLLERFQYGCEWNIYSNQLIILMVEKIP